MNNGVEKIRNEVVRLSYAYNLQADIAVAEEMFDEKICDAKYEVCKEILSFIDSMPKEKTSNEVELEANNYFFSEICGNADIVLRPEQLLGIANHFVKWGKEQMLRNAVDGEVNHIFGRSWVRTSEKELSESLKRFQHDDNVKVIIVKADDQ